MNILILGSGGREHALAWAVKQNPKTDRLIVAPGNAGIAFLAEVADIDILDGAAVVTFCEANAIDFVIIGPEAPLAAGVADATRAAGLLTFGPSADAARLEASKAFTKDICDACIAGGHDQPVGLGVLLDRPCKGMFASAGPEDEDVHARGP